MKKIAKKENKKKSINSPIHFKISLQNLQFHRYKVELYLDLKLQKTSLFLPAWSPGSYMIRDYSGHIFGMEAAGIQGNEISIEQKGLSQWDLNCNKQIVVISYFVFAYEYSVRTNFLDTEYGFINSPSLFLYPDKYLNHKITIEFDKNPFKKIYTPLRKDENNFYYAEDFNELFDSPIHLSNRSSFYFDSYSCKHEIIIEGNIPRNIKDSLINDLKRITDKQASLFGENPNPYYLFIINMTDDSYGGLEHKACSVNMFDSSKLHEHSEYLKLLGLLCHEYFHLWNVKRIRPIALGPFDYQRPALTRELWIAEGITSFYDNYILFLCGITSTNEYLSEIIADVNRLEENWGEDWMSLEESSFTAWTKYYKQHQNSNNLGISYYVKGAIFILCLDIYIREASSQKYNFFDVMKYLYKVYAVKKKRGFSKDEFFQGIVEATGIDVYTIFSEYLETPKRLPIKMYLEKIGVQISKSQARGSFPFDLKTSGSREIVSKVYMQNLNGLDISTGDEIIAVNKKRINRESFDRLKNSFEDGEEIELLVSRREKILERKFIAKNFYIYKLESVKYENNPLGLSFFEGGTSPFAGI